MALLRIRNKLNGEIVEIASLPGKKGEDGKDGKDGKNGTDGYTPIKGVDYFTLAEQEEFLASAKEYTDEKIVPATSETYGVVRVADNAGMASITGGIYADKDGNDLLSILPANEDQIDGRYGCGTVITPLNLEYAVKSVGDGYYAKVGDVASVDKWELIEEITVSEEAVVERKYDTLFKKIIVDLRSDDRIPRARLTGGYHYWEFYSYGAYQYKLVIIVGEFVAPGILSDVRAIWGNHGGNATMTLPCMDRIPTDKTFFDGFKTDDVCKVGTTIKVYGVKAE